jgi:hypothetical protein
MEREKFARLELRACSASKIQITTHEIDPTYQVTFAVVSNTSDMGHLELFRIEPRQADLPIFSGRWDLRPNTIDLDLIGDPAAGRAFRDETNGYHGHHTTVISDSPRIYGVDVHTPEGCVFRGTVTLNIGLGVSLKDSFTLEDFAQAKVILISEKEAR